MPQEQLMLLTGQKIVQSQKTAVAKNVFRKPFYEEHYGGIQSEDKKKVYFFGIIDIFTNFGATKKMEYVVKSVSQGNGISCKPPDQYSTRFIKFVDKILNPDYGKNNYFDDSGDDGYNNDIEEE